MVFFRKASVERRRTRPDRRGLRAISRSASTVPLIPAASAISAAGCVATPEKVRTSSTHRNSAEPMNSKSSVLPMKFT